LKTSPALSAAGILQVLPLAELTIPYLESLSTGELIELAAQYGLDIPYGLERVFIIEELFYLDHDAKDVNQYDIDHHDDRHDEFKEFKVLPRQYHVSCVEVLIRDPLWAFVFWEIKGYDRSHHENAEGFDGYCLRVIPLKEAPLKEGILKEGLLKEGGLQPDRSASFIVTVDIDDNGRYLGFPPDKERCYMIELCMQNHESCTVLAESRPFTLPCLIKPKVDMPVTSVTAASNEFMQTVYRNPLAHLSGVDRFSLVHSEDRPLRPRDNVS